MAAESRTTVDHDEIRTWVEQHGGVPARVAGTGSQEGGGGLRIGFPDGATEDELEQMSWDDWFAAFEDDRLAFLYQPPRDDGEDTTFVKLVDR